MRRVTGLAATALVTGVLVSGCGAVSGVVGGNSTDAYCEDLEAAQTEFAGLAGDAENPPDAESIESSITTFRDLGDSAPDEIADDWQVVTDNLDEREAVLEDAGLTWGDLASLGPEGDLPEGTTEEEVTQLGSDLQALNTPEFAEANDKISLHAREECGLEAPALPEG